ncbi:MAG TPA: hypothetical protein DDY38_01970, partial [Firmicutes bacterium]|nr:hypothetical protein [Bacillota bacterium]
DFFIQRLAPKLAKGHTDNLLPNLFCLIKILFQFWLPGKEIIHILLMFSKDDFTLFIFPVAN